MTPKGEEFAGLPTEALVEMQDKLSSDLRRVHAELLDRGYLSSDLYTRPGFAQASFYFDHIVRNENASPGDLGAVKHWLGFLIDKEIHGRAIVAARTMDQVNTRQRLAELQTAEVVR